MEHWSLRELALGEGPGEGLSGAPSPQLPEQTSCEGVRAQLAPLLPRERARESRSGGRAPGITCRPPGVGRRAL